MNQVIQEKKKMKKTFEPINWKINKSDFIVILYSYLNGTITKKHLQYIFKY